MATKSLLSSESLAEIEAVAASERKTPDALVQDALRAYKDSQGWERLLRYGANRAEESGLKKEDVNRMIAEYRHENIQPEQ